jgi:hypothetical protein
MQKPNIPTHFIEMNHFLEMMSRCSLFVAIDFFFLFPSTFFPFL